MTFFPMAGVEDWCSTSNRQGSCSPLSGVCKPMNTASLNAFKELQNQLNRVAEVKGYSKIGVDGRIGPGTVALWNKVVTVAVLWSPSKALSMAATSSCDNLAAQAADGGAATQVRQYADSLNAPVAVAGSILARPSTPNPDPSKPPIDPPALAITDTLFGMVSSPFGLVIAAGLGYAAYRLAKSGKPAPSAPKPGRRKTASARARRPSRARPTRRPSRGRRRRTRR